MFELFKGLWISKDEHKKNLEKIKNEITKLSDCVDHDEFDNSISKHLEEVTKDFQNV